MNGLTTIASLPSPAGARNTAEQQSVPRKRVTLQDELANGLNWPFVVAEQPKAVEGRNELEAALIKMTQHTDERGRLCPLAATYDNVEATMGRPLKVWERQLLDALWLNSKPLVIPRIKDDLVRKAVQDKMRSILDNAGAPSKLLTLEEATRTMQELSMDHTDAFMYGTPQGISRPGDGAKSFMASKPSLQEMLNTKIGAGTPVAPAPKSVSLLDMVAELNRWTKARFNVHQWSKDPVTGAISAYQNSRDELGRFFVVLSLGVKVPRGDAVEQYAVDLVEAIKKDLRRMMGGSVIDLHQRREWGLRTELCDEGAVKLVISARFSWDYNLVDPVSLFTQHQDGMAIKQLN